MAALRHETVDGLARLVFCNGARGNPIDAQFCAELCEAAAVLSTDERVRAVLVTAEGANFSFGGDIEAFVGDLDGLSANIKRWTATLHSAIARLQWMNAPIVAAVHGVCAGGMAALVAGADYVVAGDDARFVAAYAGIGYSCDAGASAMYVRRLGLARARKFLLLNETLDASAALSAGLVDEVAPRPELQERAEAVARKLAAGPTRAFGEMRRLLLNAGRQPLEAQLEMEAQALSRVAATRDAREGLMAFRDKRKPDFHGE
jgi:2-(1,2-epoxy-1,2-dihydrophenyl)acetyl-CoA isomerase